MIRALRTLPVLLVVCALALRVWVPAGWMPTPGAHDFAIMPCPAADPAAMPQMGHGMRHQDHSKGSGECFSPLLAGAALPDPPPAIVAPADVPSARPALWASVAINRGPAALPPPSTGPPSTA
jgi:hypothetical protein